MLPKSQRLKEKRLFNVAFSLGKNKNQKISTNLISLYYLLKRKDINKFLQRETLPKTAFIVGLKVDKRAVKRNLVKRRMRSAYRFLVANSETSKNRISALIWVANPRSKDATFEQIKDSMGNLLARLERNNK